MSGVNARGSLIRPALAVAVLAGTLLVTAPASAASAAAFPTGTLTLNGRDDPTCPDGHACRGFDVSCPGIGQVARGFLAEPPRPQSPKGLVVLFPGGSGKTWWLGDGPNAAPFLADLRAAGLHAVQIRWTIKWSTAPTGDRIGLGRMSCRPATIVRYLRNTMYPQLGAPGHPVGVCGFCVVGNSYGTTQATYPLSHYGLDGIVDVAVAASGPTTANLPASCGGNPDFRNGAHVDWVDETYGFTQNGPCVREDPAWHHRWVADGAATGGSDYRHPKTRILFIIGGADKKQVPNHVRFYEDRLRAAGSPDVTEAVIPGMGHSIKASAEGMLVLRDALVDRNP